MIFNGMGGLEYNLLQSFQILLSNKQNTRWPVEGAFSMV